jgi:UDP-2-acetamido-2,6-beta-L-arabino-hexul-4-ose reductase
MKIVLTGSTGFIGKNLRSRLEAIPDVSLLFILRNPDINHLKHSLKEADLIIHLAGESRSRKNDDAFIENIAFTQLITNHASSQTRIIFISTNKQNHQAYWQAKIQEEAMIEKKFNQSTILRLDNVFGKWALPDYNSVVATFITRIIANQPVNLFDELVPIDFLYIDEVVDRIIELIFNPSSSPRLVWKGTTQVNAKRLLETIQDIHQDYINGNVLMYADQFKQQLAITYLTYVHQDQLVIKAMDHPDQRGNFIELTKGLISGQTSINVIHQGFQKGNHYHHQRYEKFMMLSGDGVIRLRKKFESEVIEFHSANVMLQMITIPPGFIHHIENTGSSPMMVWMWSSLVYDPQSPDTFAETL